MHCHLQVTEFSGNRPENVTTKQAVASYLKNMYLYNLKYMFVCYLQYVR